jgi:SAM-dependent methyltransferase
MSARAGQQPHEARDVAESFGADPERYDRTRPRYPAGVIEAIAAAAPGTGVLDVGCGTGIVARQFAALGCRVLGVEVDPRMAGFARGRGTEVEVARFEDWDPAGRRFDAVVAGQTWHWIDPVAGAVKAAEALTPGGCLAVFWNVHMPARGLAEAFADVYRRAVPDFPLYRPGLEAYEPLRQRAAGGIRDSGAFAEPERLRFDWEQPYTREEWLEQVPTFGGYNRFPPAARTELLEGIGETIDAAGGRFTMRYAAVAVTARRR